MRLSQKQPLRAEPVEVRTSRKGYPNQAESLHPNRPFGHRVTLTAALLGSLGLREFPRRREPPSTRNNPNRKGLTRTDFQARKTPHDKAGNVQLYCVKPARG